MGHREVTLLPGLMMEERPHTNSCGQPREARKAGKKVVMEPVGETPSRRHSGCGTSTTERWHTHVALSPGRQQQESHTTEVLGWPWLGLTTLPIFVFPFPHPAVSDGAPSSACMYMCICVFSVLQTVRYPHSTRRLVWDPQLSQKCWRSKSRLDAGPASRFPSAPPSSL